MNDAAPPHGALQFGKRIAELLESSRSRRFGGHALLLTVSCLVIWMGRANVMGALPAQMELGALAELAEAVPTATPLASLVSAAPPAAAEQADITRLTDIHTFIPDRARFEISTYDVQQGDSVLGIAEKFGLTPETIVFGNPILRDNPHFLEPGQTLRIAPANGIIRDVIEGDTLGGLARVYGVTPEDIVAWPANNIDPENPQITVGQVLFVPGGTRGLLSFPEVELAQAAGAGSAAGGSGTAGAGAGQVSQRTEPWVLRSGAGQCAGGLSGGVAGSGTFIYPTNARFISGYDYGAIHPGIDLDGDIGDPVYASDSGVVVFAGWSEWGYGSTIVIAHGNGWWTLYAHLSNIFVSCGQGVYQGAQIGSVGNTGRSQGAHLHFEVYSGVYQTNPWGVLP